MRYYAEEQSLQPPQEQDQQPGLESQTRHNLRQMIPVSRSGKLQDKSGTDGGDSGIAVATFMPKKEP